MNFDPRQLENPFPPVHRADADGVLAISEFITPELTVAAYCNGIFPWPVEARHILWHAPPQRSIIRFRDFRVPHGTRRELKKKKFHFSVNQHFAEVIHACANAPREEGGTWITAKIISTYLELNRLGFAMSFETLDDDGNLAGGLYGIRIGRYFSGESMFFYESGASKYALIKMVEFLDKEYGCSWLDSQVQNSFTEMFGAVEVPREVFMRLHCRSINLK
jgi:leucyl/phenylalanyl-tRNA---protein transferase